MARDTRAVFYQALKKHETSLAQAFREAIQDIRETANLAKLEAALVKLEQTGDVARATQEVLDALNVGNEYFAPLDRALSEAFGAGGNYQADLIPKRPVKGVGRVFFRFQGRLPRAEAWTRTRSARLITEISQDERRGIRAAIDELFRQNVGPRKIASVLVGKREGNQRKGGLIGLHSRDKAAVIRARSELRAGQFAAYKRRAKHVGAATIKAAKKAGRALTETEIDRITGNYADALLRVRARKIARTEGNKAMVAGRVEAIYQMIDGGKVRADIVTLRWEATPGTRTRDSHRGLHGQEIGFGEVFVSPVTGALLRWPHDEDAPAEEVVNCRCGVTIRIAWEKMAA